MKRVESEGDHTPHLSCRAGRGPVKVISCLLRPRAMAKAKTGAVCLNCGRDFDPYKRGVQRYCTPCRNRAAKEATKTLLVLCKECGRPFKTAHRSVRYCSDPCRRVGYERVRSDARRRPRRLLSGTVNCRICGKKFKVGIGHGKRRVFCSDKCRAEGKKIRNREDMRKYLADPKRRAIQRARISLAITRQRAKDKDDKRQQQRPQQQSRDRPQSLPRRPKNRDRARESEGQRRRRRPGSG